MLCLSGRRVPKSKQRDHVPGLCVWIGAAPTGRVGLSCLLTRICPDQRDKLRRVCNRDISESKWCDNVYTLYFRGISRTDKRQFMYTMHIWNIPKQRGLQCVQRLPNGGISESKWLDNVHKLHFGNISRADKRDFLYTLRVWDIPKQRGFQCVQCLPNRNLSEL